MKSINACAALISLFLGLAVVAPSQAEDYYIYQASDGALFISNKEPPPGSRIIRQHSWPDAPETQVSQAQAQEHGKTQPEGSPKSSKEK